MFRPVAPQQARPTTDTEDTIMTASNTDLSLATVGDGLPRGGPLQGEVANTPVGPTATPDVAPSELLAAAARGDREAMLALADWYRERGRAADLETGRPGDDETAYGFVAL